ncbi:MAG: PKD domain-containing protein [Chitinophagaceae bacterium]|nr:PKD domain-containing protein [Chitinophagaceae bacterium]
MKRILLLSVLLCAFFVDSSLANVYFVTNNNPSGTGSLGGAITSANSHVGKDSVYFNIPVGSVTSRTITLSAIFPLPSITDPLVIDGTSQPVGVSFGITNAKIQIKAADYIPSAIVIAAADCEVYGLYIHHFVDGVIITGGDFKFGAVNFGNVINDCTSNCIKVTNVITGSFLSLFVGTDTLGAAGAAPLANGIYISGSKKITIGGKQAGVRNTISGNNNGLYIADSKFIDIQGNYIGTDYNGAMAVPNTNGIVMTQGTYNCEIGGDSVKERNLISGNSAAGFDLEIYSSLIDGNYIGVDASGTLPLGNGTYGIYFRNLSHDNVVGGTTAGVGNVIAYNGSEAVYFQNDGVKNISIRTNRIFCNSQLTGTGGIVTNGGNQGILPPNIVIVTPTYISGYAQPYAQIDVYAASECENCEGANFLTTVQVDATGVFIVNVASSGKVTATSNDDAGNTSAFATCQDTSSTSCIISGFSASSSAACSNVNITFTDQSLPAPGLTINSWNWDFGDGNFSTETNPSHVYALPGSYTVQLVVGSSSGCTDTTSQIITIAEGINTIISADSVGCIGTLLHFKDVSIPSSGTFIVSWAWDLGNGTTSFFNEFDYAYADPGFYTVVMSVLNSDGCPGTDTLIVNIQAAPTADFSVLPLLCPLQPAVFTDLSTAGIGDSIVSWHWNFGDGDTSILQDPSHTYLAEGIYTVELIVENSLGCASTITKTVEVIAGGDADFTFIVSGNTVFFTNTSVFPADFDVKWKFGDGSTSNQVSPTHTFATTDNYLVCMIVIDNTCGINDTTCKNVFVIVGVDEPEWLGNTTVYPNPATDRIIIDNLPASAAIQSVRLVNTIGIELKSWKGLNLNTSVLELLLPNTANGLYYLEMNVDDKIYMKKILILNP